MRQIIFLIFLALMVCGFASKTPADEINFAWDYPNNTSATGFRLYYGKVYQAETGDWLTDYIAEPLSEFSPDLRSALVPVAGEPGIIQKYCFVLKAVGPDSESEPSNEICTKIDNTALDAPVIVSGSFDRDASLVALSWETVARAKYYTVYFRQEAEDQFTALGTVDASESPQASLSEKIDVVAQGAVKTLYFVVVAFKDDITYSADSGEIAVVIDRTDGELIPPQNFRFSLLIGVQ